MARPLIHEKGHKVLVAGTLNGDVYKVDLTTGKERRPLQGRTEILRRHRRS